MVFGFLTDTIEETLDAALDSIDCLLDGELPPTRHVAKLLDAGMTIAAIASMYNVSEAAIKELVK